MCVWCHMKASENVQIGISGEDQRRLHRGGSRSRVKTHGEEIMEGPSGQRRTPGMLCSEMPLL